MPISDDVLKKNLDEFCALEVDDLLAKLESSKFGISPDDAKNRLLKYGPNVIKEEKKFDILWQLLSRFKSPLILILLVVAIISFLTGEKVDSAIVLVMVLMSVLLNFYQEFRADSAAKKLKERISTKAIVLRSGQEVEVNASEVCVGDIVEFNAGDSIIADARLITAKDFFVNQASLTGESFPVEKHAEAKDLNNIVYCGTNVVTGTATAIVLKTGEATEFGKIAKSLVEEKDENEFTRGIGKFSILILKVIIFFVLFIFLVNSFIKHDILQSLLFSVAVAVGLTPEFLPMIMSVTMGVGSVRMAKKGVLVKRLTAIPTFGSLDVLCTDKTGTLTQDKIKLIRYVDPFGADSEKVLLFAYLNSHFQTGITNPMDDAVLQYKAMDVGGYQKFNEIPFDFERKKMSIVVEKDGKRTLVTKGAPEEVFKSCKYYEMDGKINAIDSVSSDRFITQYFTLSAEGYRVLAVAMKDVDDGGIKEYKKEDEQNLVLVGFAAFLDPAKEDSKEAIDSLEQLGVEIKMLTGDNDIVAKKICRDVGIVTKGILKGEEIEKMSDEDLRKIVNEVSIFARVNPIDKNRVIEALRANGHVVGYLGDGINDALSLKAADVGVSVENAVDVAKESADIILTIKSLHQLRDGVVEGRKIFGNTMKYIMMGLSSNFGNMFSVLGAVIFLPFLPMLPVQILFNNFLYDVAQITIPTDNVDEEFLLKPKRWNIDVIKKFMICIGPISSLYDYITYFTLYFGFKLMNSSFQTGWFMESLATQTLVIYVIRTKKIPFLQSSPSKYLFLTALLAVAIGWVVPFTAVGKYFSFSPLPLPIVLLIGAYVLTYLVLVEAGKRIFYKKVNW